MLFGPESSGKTTLSRELAKHFKTDWVPEYAREYLQYKWDTEAKICEREDLVPIAKGQIDLENTMARHAGDLLICDTDLLETKVYSEAYFDGWCHPVLDRYAVQNTYDLYLLTYIDTPWEPDDLRDRPDRREEMFELFKEALDANNRPYFVLKGNLEARMTTAIQHINKLLV